MRMSMTNPPISGTSRISKNGESSSFTEGRDFENPLTVAVIRTTPT